MNNKFKDILIASDIDGTLLGSDNVIPNRNIDAIKYFCQNGGNFTIATARDTVSSKRFYDELGINIPAILCNGTILYDFKNDRFMESISLPKVAYDYMQKIKEHFPDIGIKMVCEKETFYLSRTKFTDYFDNKYNVSYKFSDMSYLPKNCNKIVFISSESIQHQLVEFIKSNANDFSEVTMAATEKFLYEMMPRDISKGTGLTILANKLHIDIKNVYALGDYYNDCDMFRVAGNAVTVANAPDEIKKMCKYIMGDFNNGAVADLIELIDKNI